MTGALVTVGVNTLAFYLISEMVPGFEIKNKKSALILAIAYSFLVGFAMLLALPISLALAFVFSILSFIPLIGPTLAGAGMLMTTFVLIFGISFGLLILIDKYMDDFKMRNRSVATISALLLAVVAVVSVIVRGMVGI